MPVWTERPHPLSSRSAARARVLALPRFSDRDRRLARRLPRCLSTVAQGTLSRVEGCGTRCGTATGAPPKRRGARLPRRSCAVNTRSEGGSRSRIDRGLLRRLGRGCSRSVHDRHHVGARPCAMTLAFSMSPTQRQSVSGHCTAPLSNRSRAPSPGAPERVDRCGRILERAVRSRPRTAERRGARNPRSACAGFPAEPRRRGGVPFPACGARLGRGCACAAPRGSRVIRHPGAASTGGITHGNVRRGKEKGPGSMCPRGRSMCQRRGRSPAPCPRTTSARRT
jgi:hypothetical protein